MKRSNLIGLFVYLTMAPHLFAADRGNLEIAEMNQEVLVRESGIIGADLQKREQLLGDIGGLRRWLSQFGMTLEIASLDEGFAKPSGGNTETGQSYAGLTDIVLSLDTESVDWWDGGTFVIDLQNVRGGDISDDVGDLQGISNIVGPPGTRFAEYHLVQELFGGNLSFKVGKQDANADFVVSDGGSEFINSSFGIIPTVPLPTYPAPALGVMGVWSVTDRIGVRAGYWDGAPAVGSGCIVTAFDGHGGEVGAIEFEIEYHVGDVHSGDFRVGLWRHSETALLVRSKGATGHETGPAEGVYFTLDQSLSEDGNHSIAFFAQGGWSQADRSAVSRYLGGGLIFVAPFKGRPKDVLGIGIAWAEVGDLERISPDCGSETLVELFYKMPLSPWMTLHPDLQWVQHPHGGRGSAFVAGLRVATLF